MTKLNVIICILLALLPIGCSAKEETQDLKVLQINLWHATSVFPEAFDGLISIIEQTDPDIVLLSEVRNSQNIDLIAKITNALQEKGKKYYGESATQSAGMISKHEIVAQELCCHSNIQGPMTKTSIAIGGHTLVVYSTHLDFTHYACYLPRGYSGANWKKLDAPVLDADSIMEANRLSDREETIAKFIEDAKMEIGKGNLVLIGGDFNEPSHLDWQADTKNMRDHNGVIANWDCSVMLTEMGMLDSFRELFPDAVKYPGFTFPSANNAVAIEKLAWAPDADERDRIDFIYYYPNSAWSLSNVSIVGPEETICKGKIKEKDSEDSFIVPVDVWPTDHKGNLATFSIKKKIK